MRRFPDSMALELVLGRLAGLMRGSRVFAAQSEGRKFVAVVETVEPRGGFYLLLDHGRVDAGTRAFPTHATLRMSLPADTLHRVLCGSVHPAQLVFDRRVRVVGNIFAGFGLQSLLPEAIRLYGIVSGPPASAQSG